MGVRPPPEDDDEPDVITFGIAALDGRLERADIEFPADEETVLAALGDAEIPYDGAGHTMPLSAALDDIPASRFETKQDLLNALHPVFEERRDAAPAGIVAQLRAMLPFHLF